MKRGRRGCLVRVPQHRHNGGDISSHKHFRFTLSIPKRLSYRQPHCNSQLSIALLDLGDRLVPFVFRLRNQNISTFPLIGIHLTAITMANSQQDRLTITCHCKAIRLTFPPLREPANECLCSVCRRYGALWAYYKEDEVEVEGDAIEGYAWRGKKISFNRCKHCGCMTHYTVLRDTEPRVAVNCRMLEKEEYEKLESEQSDGDD
jgi:hypothetical protein